MTHAYEFSCKNRALWLPASLTKIDYCYDPLIRNYSSITYISLYAEDMHSTCSSFKEIWNNGTTNNYLERFCLNEANICKKLYFDEASAELTTLAAYYVENIVMDSTKKWKLCNYNDYIVNV
jgi:hypothetical protein